MEKVSNNQQNVMMHVQGCEEMKNKNKKDEFYI